jgi:crotonobetainyl-CoA:carnitine CoA-transferase CaiB-like acyl-CoA transferase
MRTKDGYISIAPYADERWVRFFRAAGHPEVLEEERFKDKVARRARPS